MFSENDQRPKALLLPAPKENHTFGLLTMSELLRRRWNVVGGLPMNEPDMMRLAGSTQFAMIGFSLSAEVWLKCTAAAIRRVRRKSLNKNVKILVGGCAAALRQSLAAELGADSAFADAADACTYADNLAAQQSGASV